MRITPRIIEVLKNYVIINPSILFMPGDEISTISPLKSILSVAKVDEVFTHQFAIYDLNEFIGMLSIMDEPVAEFTESQIIIKSGRKTVKYTYGSPDTFECSPYDFEGITLDEDDIISKFQLSYIEFNNIVKACSILKNKSIVIEGSENNLEIKSADLKNKTSSDYAINLNEKIVKPTMAKFRRVFDIENFKIMHRDYLVSIHRDNLITFENNDEYRTTYWIAPSADNN